MVKNYSYIILLLVLFFSVSVSAQEAKQQNDIYSSFTASSWQSMPHFIAPTSGKFSNSFGRKRFFNGEERAPHSGLDIPAPIGQKVIAPGEDRTHDLKIMRLTRYLLRHRGSWPTLEKAEDSGF